MGDSMTKKRAFVKLHLFLIENVVTFLVRKLVFKDRKNQVTAIVESKDLDSMSLATLFGKLQEDEMKLGHLTLHEQTDKNLKGGLFQSNKFTFKKSRRES
ncbi:hypothetical protein Lal_00038634 [Lupinus albus]|nr:hypothetical protein Lal_00038634 [Lupinus albus]